MARDKSINLELRDIQQPDWIGQWATDNKGEAMFAFLLFAPETSVSKYFNKKYPEDVKDYSAENNNFEHYDFADEGWDTYIKMKNEDPEMGEGEQQHD